MQNRIIAAGPVLPLELGETVRNAFFNNAYPKLVAALERITGVSISGLIVYGSRASLTPATVFGDADVDLLVLVDEPALGGVFGRAGEVEIDLHLHSRDDALSGPIAEWALYSKGRVLHDVKAPELNHWLQRLSDWKSENPDPWSDVDQLKNRVWAYRIIDRIARLAPIDPAVAVLHESRLLATLSTLHAQVRRTHTTSISHWWAGLTGEDQRFAEAISTYASTRTYPPDAQALRKLVDTLYQL